MHKELPKLDLNITNRCNFQCMHCAFDSGCKEMAELSVPQLTRILRDTKELGGKKIDITGGEPTLRHDLDDILSVGKSCGFTIELVTNASLIDRTDLKRFQRLGLDSIAISLDGPEYITYAGIRRVSPETYQHVRATIDDAIDLGIPTKVNTVAFTSNMQSIPAITQFCIEHGAYEHGIYYFTPVGRGTQQQLSIEPLAWLSFLRQELSPYGKRIKLSVEVPLLEKSRLSKRTDCILFDDPFHLQILPDGNVYPCAIMASHGLAAGNLLKRQVRDIWQDEAGWDAYAGRVKTETFDRFGSCVDFSTFKMTEYDRERYGFVCPLRKFLIGEIL